VGCYSVITIEDFMGTCFGRRLVDIITALCLPTPIIKGSQMTKFKKGVWVIIVVQLGRETESSMIEAIKFKLLHIDE
jgi:hypothetical protein